MIARTNDARSIRSRVHGSCTHLRSQPRAEFPALVCPIVPVSTGRHPRVVSHSCLCSLLHITALCATFISQGQCSSADISWSHVTPHPCVTPSALLVALHLLLSSQMEAMIEFGLYDEWELVLVHCGGGVSCAPPEVVSLVLAVVGVATSVTSEGDRGQASDGLHRE